MKKAIIVSDNLNNIGDLALLLQCAHGLRQHVGDYPLVVRQWNQPGPDVMEVLEKNRIGLLVGRKFFRSLWASVNSLILIGGGQAVRDNSSSASLIGLAAMMVVARATLGATAVVACGVSPIEKPFHRTIWRMIFKGACIITTRDAASQDQVVMMNSALGPHLHSDLIFLASPLRHQLSKRLQSSEPRIVVSPCNDTVEGRQIRMSAIVDLVIHNVIRLSCVQVSLIAHDIRENADKKICTAIKAALIAVRPDLDIEILASSRIEDYIDRYRRASIVITNRLHSALFGLLAVRPVLIIDDGNPKTNAAALRFSIATVRLDYETAFAKVDMLMIQTDIGAPTERLLAVQCAEEDALQTFVLLRAAIGR